MFIASSSYAHEEIRFQASSSPSIEQAIISISSQLIPAEDTQGKTAEYYPLPYPGMLPDSPFYILKVVRDKIISFLISDPLKRAEFNLLQADKRLQAGVFLAEKNTNKTALAISTVSKGQNYFEEAIYKTQEAKSQGKDVSGILDRLIAASRKHQEVLQSLQRDVAKEGKGDVAAMQKRMEELEKTAIKIKQ